MPDRVRSIRHNAEACWLFRYPSMNRTCTLPTASGLSVHAVPTSHGTSSRSVPFSRLQSVREQVVVSRVVEYFQVEHEMDDLCRQCDGAVLPVLGYGVLDKDGLSGQTDVFSLRRVISAGRMKQ